MTNLGGIVKGLSPLTVIRRRRPVRRRRAVLDRIIQLMLNDEKRLILPMYPPSCLRILWYGQRTDSTDKGGKRPRFWAEREKHVL